ncbi:DUF3244 domain-containing protein [Spirosoma validum]|uniref:DUF3244 domain-containing protein n=1 Tax=Spirosoma validum TaxID=2771355 RepID=A0A927B616_9BACT|nr:DUF3244 domain-containing protein [Spirosoma validum]MBD2755943.1 DUF3244 domain-containing protein [Spirosoma validum]
MKTNRFFAYYSTLAVVATCLLSAPSTHAQTFTGREKLTVEPISFQAIAYPVTNTQAAIRVNFDNRTAGGVSVAILDEKGHRLYNRFETTVAYRCRLDLSSLPAGKYTLELSKKGEYFTRSFTIEPPTMGYITMGDQPVQRAPEQVVDKKLVVSY